MSDETTGRRRSRVLGERSLLALMRLLRERGLSDDDVERGLDYVEETGARTLRQGFELAMTRIIYSDAQLAAGSQFRIVDDASDARGPDDPSPRRASAPHPDGGCTH